MAFAEVAGGAALGFGLSQLSSWLARKEQREFDRAQRVREREHDAAEVLDDALRQAKWRLPAFVGTPEARQAVWDAHDAWQDGWFRAGHMLRDDRLVDRYRGAGWALLSCILDEDRGTGADTWIAGRAISSARAGLAAFLREEELPQPTFPSRAEIPHLAPVKPSGPDYSGLNDWLAAHPEPE